MEEKECRDEEESQGRKVKMSGQGAEVKKLGRKNRRKEKE